MSIQICQKIFFAIIVFFSFKKYFRNISYYYLILKAKKVYNLKKTDQTLKQTLSFLIFFSDYILFIFLYSRFLLCPPALLFLTDTVPLTVSTDFPALIRRKNLFLDCFCKCSKIQHLPCFQSTSFQNGTVVLRNFVSGFANPILIIGTGRTDFISIHMKPYSLS